MNVELYLFLQEFGPDDTPLSENEFTLPLLSRTRRSLENNSTRVIATLPQQDLEKLVSRLNLTLSGTHFYEVPLFRG